MPRIQTYTRQNFANVLPQGATIAASPIGSALQEVGQAVGTLGQDLQRADAIKRQKDEQDAVSQSTKTLTQARLDWTQKLATMQDAAEPGANGFRGQVQAEFEKYKADVLQSANPLAKPYVEAHLDDLQADLIGKAMGFEAAERGRKRRADLEDSLNLGRNTLVRDPGQFGKVYQQQIDGLAALGLPPTEQAGLKAYVGEGLALSTYQGLIRLNPYEAQKQLQSGSGPAAYLDADKTVGLLGDAEREIRSREAEAKQRHAEFVGNYLAGLDDYVAARADGNAPFNPAYAPDRIRATVGGAQGERAASAVEFADKTGEIVSKIATASPDEVAKMDADLQADLHTGDTTGYSIKAKEYEIFSVARKRREDGIAADPAGYVVKNFPTVGTAFTAYVGALSNPTATPEQLHGAGQAYKTAVTTAQAGIGVAQRHQEAFPQSFAKAAASNIMAQPNPKAQFQSLMRFVDPADDGYTRSVVGSLVATGQLPVNAAMVVDYAVENRTPDGQSQLGVDMTAERMWAQQSADTKGVDLPATAKKTLAAKFDDGIGAVIRGQAVVTGDFDTAMTLTNQFMASTEQAAKAAGTISGDFDTAAADAVDEYSTPYALIHDDQFAEVMYPAKLEAKSPGAVEHGLHVLRELAAAQFPKDPYSQATARDILDHAVWVNQGDGFALIVPGSNRTLPIALDKDLTGRQPHGHQQRIDRKNVFSYQEVADIGLASMARKKDQHAYPLSGRAPDAGVEPMVAP
jgi:hypothetical protein